MKFVPNCTAFSKKLIKNIEERYNAKFVFDTQITLKDGTLSNSPWAIFYIANRSAEDIEKYPNASNYIALKINFATTPKVMIADGISATIPFNGLMLPNKRVIYSSYRHHCNLDVHTEYYIDGGRDYLRCYFEAPAKIVTCKLINGIIQIEN